MRSALRLSGIAPLLALALLAAATPADAKPRKAKRCPAAGARLPQSPQAHLYMRSGLRGYDSQHGIYGCDLKTRRRTLLVVWADCGCSIADEPRPTEIWVSGRHAAVNDTWATSPPWDPVYTGDGELEVTDLRSGRVRYRHDTGGGVNRLVLKANGSVAFTQGGSLTRITAAGAELLDTRADPESLASSDRHLYWLRDGLAQAAPFD
jgi:hypothetical protein